MKYQTFNYRFSVEILRSKGLLEEILDVIESTERFESEILKSNFRQKGWNTEEHLSGEVKTEKDWRYDAFKQGVAIEIEKGGTAYRDFLKFMLGSNIGKVDVCVLICPYIENGTRGHPMSVTVKELRDARMAPFYALY